LTEETLTECTSSANHQAGQTWELQNTWASSGAEPRKSWQRDSPAEHQGRTRTDAQQLSPQEHSRYWTNPFFPAGLSSACSCSSLLSNWPSRLPPCCPLLQRAFAGSTCAGSLQPSPVLPLACQACAFFLKNISS